MLTLDRRTAIKAAALAAVPLSAGSFHAYFQHSVASGDPYPDSILLWTRVTPTPESF